MYPMVSPAALIRDASADTVSTVDIVSVDAVDAVDAVSVGAVCLPSPGSWRHSQKRAGRPPPPRALRRRPGATPSVPPGTHTERAVRGAYGERSEAHTESGQREAGWSILCSTSGREQHTERDRSGPGWSHPLQHTGESIRGGAGRRAFLKRTRRVSGQHWWGRSPSASSEGRHLSKV